jgi:hypothetical protein
MPNVDIDRGVVDLEDVLMQGVRVTFYDFPSAETYRFIHHLFLSEEALIFIVFSLLSPDEEVRKSVTFWCDSVLHRFPKTAIFLIGNFAKAAGDDVDTRMIRLQEDIKTIYGKESSVTAFAVDSSSGFGVPALTSAIFRLTNERVFQSVHRTLKPSSLFLL